VENISSGEGKRGEFRVCLKEPIDGNILMFCGIEFETVGAANRKALRPVALAVKGIRSPRECVED